MIAVGEEFIVGDKFTEIRDVESRARRFETPCGEGRLVWHQWGEGRPVLMLHGGSGSWLHWLKQIPALESNHSVWVPDLPGMGESHLPPEPYEVNAYADIVQSGFERLSPGAGAIDLVGFSFGAGLSGRIACRMPGRIGHMVLSGANFFEPRPMRRRANLLSLKRIVDPAERLRAVKNNLQVMMVRHDKNIDDLAIHLYDTDTARRRLPRVSFSGFPTLRVDIGQMKISGRLTAIAGADDQIIGHDPDGQRAQLLSISPKALYHGIAGAGHWVMYEGAQGYNAALAQALAA
ncbi:MAG: alpha/beta fold hydrolase [Betaproteobacteria bacterium]|nr:alpha/beta fold hydrolase [Betaproteobacteria bacterium]